LPTSSSDAIDTMTVDVFRRHRHNRCRRPSTPSTPSPSTSYDAIDTIAVDVLRRPRRHRRQRHQCSGLTSLGSTLQFPGLKLHQEGARSPVDRHFDSRISIFIRNGHGRQGRKSFNNSRTSIFISKGQGRQRMDTPTPGPRFSSRRGKVARVRSRHCGQPRDKSLFLPTMTMIRDQAPMSAPATQPTSMPAPAPQDRPNPDPALWRTSTRTRRKLQRPHLDV